MSSHCLNERLITFVPKASILTVVYCGFCRRWRTAVSGVLILWSPLQMNPHHLEFGSRRETPSLQQVLFFYVPAFPFYSTSTACREVEQFAIPHHSLLRQTRGAKCVACTRALGAPHHSPPARRPCSCPRPRPGWRHPPLSSLPHFKTVT